MPNYKLHYFNARGAGEVARLLFAQNGVQYEDCRYNGEEWTEAKKDREKFPLGQMPVLEIDAGKYLCQSNSINRFLARQFDMAGKDNFETTRIDVLCETCRDLGTALYNILTCKDEAKKAELSKEFEEVKSKILFGFFNKALERNNGGKGYFVGDKMTLADVTVFSVFDVMSKMRTVMMEQAPLLKVFVERMRKEPKIAAWIAKRPETEF